jgi:endoglucanase
MKKAGIAKRAAPLFLPPFEWFNDSISRWTKDEGLSLINYTPGTMANADYTYPGVANYRSSDTIYHSILSFEREHPAGLNGFILLMHIGTDPRRRDKFYNRLSRLIGELKRKNYQFKTVKTLLLN